MSESRHLADQTLGRAELAPLAGQAVQASRSRRNVMLLVVLVVAPTVILAALFVSSVAPYLVYPFV